MIQGSQSSSLVDKQTVYARQGEVVWSKSELAKQVDGGQHHAGNTNQTT